MSFIAVIVVFGFSLSVATGCSFSHFKCCDLSVLRHCETVACHGQKIGPSLMLKLPLLTSDHQRSAPDSCTENPAPHSDSYRREASSCWASVLTRLFTLTVHWQTFLRWSQESTWHLLTSMFTIKANVQFGWFCSRPQLLLVMWLQRCWVIWLKRHSLQTPRDTVISINQNLLNMIKIFIDFTKGSKKTMWNYKHDNP